MAARGAWLLLFALCGCRTNEQLAKPAAATASSPKPDSAGRPSVVLADAGQPRLTIVVPPRLLAEPATGRKRPRRSPQAKILAGDEQRLRDSVTDLAAYLKRISGAEVKVVPAPAPSDGKTLPLLLGEAAQERFKEAPAHAPGAQGFRYIVTPSAIALYGESDLATSYAIYELLSRLGCRWFMPGQLGEHVPSAAHLTLAEANEALAPSTYYRGLWYADEAYKRRNRLGGTVIAAGHKLEAWVSKEQRDEHPEWRAMIKGVPHATRLRWSSPEVADAIAMTLAQQIERRGAASLSISPADGVDFDETLDKAIDASDFDPTMNRVSITDRLLVLANRVAAKTAAKHPDVLLGLLAYSSYTRPPVRERVHPSIVPVIAPITYCRQRPISDDQCPGARDLRAIVEGWATRSSMLAYRSYGYNLAEPSAPHPMLAKWSFDLPFMFKNKVRFFQPETIANFDTTLPGLYLGVRLAWNNAEAPQAIASELFETFYGHAGKAVRQYNDVIDHAWTDTPDYSGGGLGYGRRFPPELLTRARLLLNAAKAACATDLERKRVQVLDESLQQFELYMKMFRDIRKGHLSSLSADLEKWSEHAGELSERYAENYAFAKAGWAGPTGIYGNYVNRFLKPTYTEATRISREQVLLTATPLCSARFRWAPELKLPMSGAPLELSDSEPTTDFCFDTWSALGHHDYFGAIWYQVDVELGALRPRQRTVLWLTNVDGVAQVWVNGTAVPGQGPTNTPSATTVEAHLKSVTFDLSGALREKAKNRLTIVMERTRLAELGGGGLMGPVYLYTDR